MSPHSEKIMVKSKLVQLTLNEGIQLSVEHQVTKEELATSIGTGKVQVLATSAMISLMEKACVELIEDGLPEGCESISAEMNVKHLNPVKEGEQIIIKAHLKFIDINKLFFDVVVLDAQHNTIGLGGHERYVVDHDVFMAKL